jgi:hypothetical protein
MISSPERSVLVSVERFELVTSGTKRGHIQPSAKNVSPSRKRQPVGLYVLVLFVCFCSLPYNGR